MKLALNCFLILKQHNQKLRVTYNTLHSKRDKTTFTLNLLVLITNNTNNLNLLIRPSPPPAHHEPRTSRDVSAPQHPPSQRTLPRLSPITATPCCVPLRAPAFVNLGGPRACLAGCASRVSSPLLGAARIPPRLRFSSLLSILPRLRGCRAARGSRTLLSGANPSYFSRYLSSLDCEERRSAKDTPRFAPGKGCPVRMRRKRAHIVRLAARGRGADRARGLREVR